MKRVIEQTRAMFKAASREPVSEGTKKIRRNLIATSVVAILVENAGFRPAKIAALGIEQIPPDIIPILVACLTWYLLIGFFLHSTKDFLLTSQNALFSQLSSALGGERLSVPVDDTIESNESLDAELAALERTHHEGAAFDEDDYRRIEVIREHIRVIRQRAGAAEDARQILSRERVRSAMFFHIVSQGYDNVGALALGGYAGIITLPTLWSWLFR